MPAVGINLVLQPLIARMTRIELSATSALSAVNDRDRQLGLLGFSAIAVRRVRDRCDS